MDCGLNGAHGLWRRFGAWVAGEVIARELTSSLHCAES